MATPVSTPKELPATTKAIETPSNDTNSDKPYWDLFVQYFGSQVQSAYAVCTAENQGHIVDKINYANSDGSFDSGLCQINSCHYDRVNNLSELLNPETNIRVASELYKEQGFGIWVQYQNGEYLKFM